MHSDFLHYARMDGPRANRLKQARERAGFEDATQAARRFGWTLSTYYAHENGSRGFNVDKGRAYAKAFKVNAAWLLTGEGSITSTTKIPISGYVGAGAVIIPSDEIGPDGIEEIELPPGEYGDLLAFKVRGDSNYPAYRDGEVIFVQREGGPPTEYINRECVVRTRDGRRLLKTLTMGARAGLFTLVSINFPPLPDQPVEWASAVEWVKKG